MGEEPGSRTALSLAALPSGGLPDPTPVLRACRRHRLLHQLTVAESLVIGQDRLERIGEHTGKIPKIEDDIARLDKEIAVVRAQIDPLEWMNGIVIAGILALIIKTFFA